MSSEDPESVSPGGHRLQRTVPTRPLRGIGGSKIVLLAALLALLAVMAVFRFLPGTEEEILAPLKIRTPAVERGTTLRISVDPEFVFTKAFWRRPGAGDKILHAERLEWTDRSSGKVVKWQWFLAVEPGPATRAWLSTNPFDLTAGLSNAEVGEDSYRPEWFPGDFSDQKLLVNTNGHYKLATSSDGERLYATDFGFGLTGARDF